MPATETITREIPRTPIGTKNDRFIAGEDHHLSIDVPWMTAEYIGVISIPKLSFRGPVGCSDGKVSIDLPGFELITLQEVLVGVIEVSDSAGKVYRVGTVQLHRTPNNKIQQQNNLVG